MKVILDLSLAQIDILKTIIEKELVECEKPNNREKLKQPIGIHKRLLADIYIQLAE